MNIGIFLLDPIRIYLCYMGNLNEKVPHFFLFIVRQGVRDRTPVEI